MKHNYLKSYPQVTSVCLHCFILLLFIVYFDFSPAQFNLGQPTIQVMNSYVFQNELVNHRATTQTASAPVRKPVIQAPHNLAEKGILNTARTPTPVSVDQTAEASSARSTTSSGQQATELLTMLHSAIQKEQHYPPSALQMEREGKVTVTFTLYANGSISDLKIMKTSGTDSLDAAALAAVHDAVPFNQVSQYLHEPQVYSIDVAFELT